MKKSCGECAPKASLRPFSILVNTQTHHCMQEILLEIRYFERGLSKSLKKLTLFFF